MIINDDCFDVLMTINPKDRMLLGREVEVIFMDPPDNVGLNYHSYADKKDKDDYYQWLYLLISESMSRCKTLWVCYALDHDIEIGFIVRNLIKYRFPTWKWSKMIWRFTFGQYNDKDCAIGYRPILRLMRQDAVVYTEKVREYSQRQMMGDNRAAGDRVPDNVWNFPRIVGNSPERVDWMPTQLPIKLMERIINLSLPIGNGNASLFVDLFGGSGSSLMAVKTIGKEISRVVVVEKDKYTCERIAERTGDEILSGMRYANSKTD